MQNSNQYGCKPKLMTFYQYYAHRKKHPLGVWVHRRQASGLAALLCRYLSAPGRVLEIGPGDGYFLQECKRLGFQYAAVEASAELAKELRQTEVDIREAFVPPIPLDAQSVEVCCLFHVLEHMSNTAQADELLQEVRRVLVPGGFLFVACPNYNNWGEDFYEIDYTHNYVTSPRRVHQQLSDVGYRILEVRFYSGPIFGPLRYVPLFLSRFLYWRWLNGLVGSDLYYKAYVTFRENFVIVAQAEDR